MTITEFTAGWVDRWPRVIAKAWLDADFRKKLLDTPHEALREPEFGLEVPAGMTLKVVPGDSVTTLDIAGPGPTVILRLPDRPADLAAREGESIESLAAKVEEGSSEETFPCF